MQTDRFGLMPISSANVATWWLAAVEHPCYRDFLGGGHARLELDNFRCRNARHALRYPQVGCEPHSSSCRHSSFSSRPADLSYSAKGRRNRCRSVGRADLAYDPDSGFDIGTWDSTARQRRLRSIAKRGPPATEWLTRLPITYGGFWANADWPLRINADQQCERRDLVESGHLAVFSHRLDVQRLWPFRAFQPHMPMSEPDNDDQHGSQKANCIASRRIYGNSIGAN